MLKQLRQDAKRRARLRARYQETRILKLAKNKNHRQINKEKIKARRLELHLLDKTKRNSRQNAAQQLDREANPEKYRQWRMQPEAKARRNKKTVEYNRRNYHKIYARLQERLKAEPNLRIKLRLRARLSRALKGVRKSGSTIELLGCSSWEDFRNNIAAKFKPGMDFSNYGYGKNKWVLDHIRPLASFNLSDPSEQAIAFHISNLQPLWCVENSEKSATWDGRYWHGRQRRLLSPENQPKPSYTSSI